MINRFMKDCGELVLNSKIITRAIRERYSMNHFEYVKFRVMDDHEEEDDEEPCEEEIQRHISINSMEKVSMNSEFPPAVASVHEVRINSSSSMMEPTTPLTNESSKGLTILRMGQ